MSLFGDNQQLKREGVLAALMMVILRRLGLVIPLGPGKQAQGFSAQSGSRCACVRALAICMRGEEEDDMNKLVTNKRI